jgi:TRAP-type C4-dicarboxylate transport system substrate-binding protein
MRLNRRGSPVRTARWRSACCAVAVVALVTPLVGCGATDPSASAAGEKAGGSVPAEPVVLRMLNPIDPSSTEDFIDQVNKVSDGMLTIEPIDHWHEDAPDRATRERSIFDAIRSGEAPLAATAVRAWHDQGFRSFDALITPMLIDRPDVETAVLHGDVATDMLARLDGSGLTGIGILPGPILHPGGLAHPLVDVADYRETTVSLAPNAVGQKWLESLGATPQPTMFLDDADFAGVGGFALQVSSAPSVASAITTNVAIGPRPLVIYGNAAALAGLSEQNRKYLRDAALATIDVKVANDQAREIEDAAVLCRVGTDFVTAGQAQVDALRAASEPVYQWLREDPATSGFLDRIQQIADDTPIDPDSAAPGCPAASTSPASAGSAASTDTSPIDGTYRSVVTKEQAVAAGAGADNSGETVLVIDHGRFAHAGHNDQDCTWAYGTVTLDGDTMTWTYQDGGGHGAVNRPGEVLAFRWSLYRDLMSLTNAPGAISPVPEGASWDLTRTGDPDPSALGPQCPPPAAAFPH